MTYAIITVAGVSSRFNENEKEPVLKCLYNLGDKKKTLLYSILKKTVGCDGVVVVGGYQYDALMAYIKEIEGDFSFSIDAVYNPHYEKYGSGYSLKLGLQKCLEQEDCTEIIFIEGDLYFDQASMQSMMCHKKNYLTINHEAILAKKAVALYINEQEEIKYLYDTQHGALEIKEPFVAIYNSGQVWKFAERDYANQVFQGMDECEWWGTNLVFIEKYFRRVSRESVEILAFKEWTNCNTRSDFLECERYL